ncbi:MAG: DUF2490 domain-containing protein [Christiangramia sp.]|nr:hypothetical protein [Christiangramia sp.]
MKKAFLVLLPLLFFGASTFAQEHDSKWGAWYMYFLNHQIQDSKFGIQADVQYRDWQLGGDFQQSILRGALTYQPIPEIKAAFGYSYFVNGPEGNAKTTSMEHRIFQDINFPQKVGSFMSLNHRLRLEERWVEDQDFRTRVRYAAAFTIPITKNEHGATGFYFAIFDEIFINGQTHIGNGREVGLFDRNWLYGALGYALSKNLKVQLGALNQVTENSVKNNLQVSLIHSF